MIEIPAGKPWLRALGSVAVLAPHPDDESLGCGGIIARLCRLHARVDIIFVTDGTGSHPNSARYPGARLSQLRRREATDAAAVLGVPPTRLHFLGLTDRETPFPGQPGYEASVLTLRRLLARMAPDTVLVPWRRDQHHDHRSTYLMADQARRSVGYPLRLLEYGVWVWLLAPSATDLPQVHEVMCHRLPLHGTERIKRLAIARHKSQTTGLIDDDPTGFQLSAAHINSACGPYEILMEAR